MPGKLSIGAKFIPEISPERFEVWRRKYDDSKKKKKT
jgi:hypothetical protein